MRPYLAIIKDSFRQVISSKVLYVMLIVISLLLLIVFPLHFTETLDWKLTGRNVANSDQLFERFVSRHDQDGEEVITYIWNQLTPKLQTQLTDRVEAKKKEAGKEKEAESKETEPRRGPPRETDREKRRLRDSLLSELNSIIEKADFYSEEIWEGRVLGSEAAELIESGVSSLGEERLRRLNRLLVNQAVSPLLRSGSPTSLVFKYTPWKTITEANTTRGQFKSVIASWIPYILDKFVLSIGLVIAIIVTSGMIPETFEPGSLNLLLSKPISRWALLVSKFLGGCAFVALCASYLFIGLWMWLGIGFKIWDPAILWCIPIYILVFGIYYSVSTFWGVWYRSPIVSVMLTILFWAFCFGVGSLYIFIDKHLHNASVTTPVIADSKLVTSNLFHSIYDWSDSESNWSNRTPKVEDKPEAEFARVILEWMSPKLDRTPDEDFAPVLGPVFASGNSQLLIGLISFGDPESMMSGQKIYSWDLTEKEPVALGTVPPGTEALFNDDLGPFVVDGRGYFRRLDLEKAMASKEGVKPPSEFKEDKPKPKRRTSFFTLIGPTQKQLVGGPECVAFNAERNELAIVDRLGVYVYSRNEEGNYEKDRQVMLDVDLPRSLSGGIAYSGDRITVVLGNGLVVTLDAKTLKELRSYQPETRSAFRQIVASSDGSKVGITYRNGNLWLLDFDNDGQMTKANVTGQGTIAGVGFDQNKVYVCDRTDRVTAYDLDSFSVEQTYLPPGDIVNSPLRFSYRYIVSPFYTLCPKPGEFYKLVTHLSTANDSELNKQVDLREFQEKKNPWLPLWSGMGFMCFMLFISCCVFTRADY